jgi:transposase
MKILALARASPHSETDKKETSSSRERTGQFTSGIVSTRQGQQIALFFTGRKHAGENLAQVLMHRAAGRAAPIQMCDALSRNLPGKLETIVGNCLAHGRRHFVEVTPHFPQECRLVLETLGEVYGYEAQAEKQGLSPEERLRFHQEHTHRSWRNCTPGFRPSSTRGRWSRTPAWARP